MAPGTEQPSPGLYLFRVNGVATGCQSTGYHER
jgi:hypothetical protein